MKPELRGKTSRLSSDESNRAYGGRIPPCSSADLFFHERDREALEEPPEGILERRVRLRLLAALLVDVHAHALGAAVELGEVRQPAELLRRRLVPVAASAQGGLGNAWCGVFPE